MKLVRSLRVVAVVGVLTAAMALGFANTSHGMNSFGAKHTTIVTNDGYTGTRG